MAKGDGAKGRKPGVLIFPFKPFYEGILRKNSGIEFDKVLTETERNKLMGQMADEREALRLERDKDLKNAPHTQAMVELFVEQLRASLIEVERTGGLRQQLEQEREERLALQAKLVELEKQLERAKKAKRA